MKRFAELPVVLQLVVVAFVGGSIGPLSKLALQDIPPVSFAALRLLIIAVVLTLCMRLVFKTKTTWKKIRLFLGVSTLWWVSIVLTVRGLSQTTAINAQLIHALIPIIAALCALFILKQRLRGLQWLGVLIAAAGAVIIIVGGSGLRISAGALQGNLIVLASAAVAALYVVLSQSEKYADIAPYEMIFISSAIGAVAMAPFAVHDILTRQWLGVVSAQDIVALVMAGVMSGVFYVLYQWLMRRIGPSQATLNLYLLPLFVAGWAVVLVNEHIGLPAVVGGGVALFGVWIVIRRSGSKEINPSA